MLIIRDAQMQALKADRTATFLERLSCWLSQRLTEAGMAFDPAQQDQAIARASSDASRFGITREADVARFIELTLLHRDAMPGGVHPRPALAILMTHGQDPKVKLDRFEAWLEREEGSRHA